MENEIWFDVPSYEGSYQYSDNLRFKSLPRVVVSKDGTGKNMKGKLMKILTPTNTCPYPRICFCINSVSKFVLVHVFFAKQFIPNPENKKVVNHKNGNKLDYSLGNLEWATKSEDVQHAYDTGLRVAKKGVESPIYGKPSKTSGANGTWSKLVLDLDTGIFYDTILEAAKAKNMDATTLSRQLNGRTIKNSFNMVLV